MHSFSMQIPIDDFEHFELMTIIPKVIKTSDRVNAARFLSEV